MSVTIFHAFLFTYFETLKSTRCSAIAERPHCTVRYSFGLKSNTVSLIQNFRYKGLPPPIIFTRIVRPMNALQLCRCDSFHTKKLFSRLSSSEVRFSDRNRPFCVLHPPPPLWGLGATYDGHLRLIGKRVVHFLLVLIELFSLGVTAEAL